MARVTYAALGLAFAALVSGFFIRDSSIPLIASIALSAVVSVLILVGWTRKMRREGLGLEPEEVEVGEIEDIALVEFDEEGEVEKAEVEEVATGKKRGRRLEKVLAGISRQPAPDVGVVEPPAETSRPKAAPRPKAATRAKPTVRSKAAAGSRSRAKKKVFVIPGRERYHSAECRYAKGDDLREVSEDLARKRGYTPCGLCLKK